MHWSVSTEERRGDTAQSSRVQQKNKAMPSTQSNNKANWRRLVQTGPEVSEHVFITDLIFNPSISSLAFRQFSNQSISDQTTHISLPDHIHPSIMTTGNRIISSSWFVYIHWRSTRTPLQVKSCQHRKSKHTNRHRYPVLGPWIKLSPAWLTQKEIADAVNPVPVSYRMISL